MHRYRDLKFWSDSVALSVDVYRITTNFPKEEKFGIVDQMRRTSVSIPSNIAEGSSRGTNKDFKRFVSHSMGSAYELETQLRISKDLGFVSLQDHDKISSEILSVIKQMSKFRSKCRK